MSPTAEERAWWEDAVFDGHPIRDEEVRAAPRVVSTRVDYELALANVEAWERTLDRRQKEEAEAVARTTMAEERLDSAVGEADDLRQMLLQVSFEVAQQMEEGE